MKVKCAECKDELRAYIRPDGKAAIETDSTFGESIWLTKVTAKKLLKFLKRYVGE